METFNNILPILDHKPTPTQQEETNRLGRYQQEGLTLMHNLHNMPLYKLAQKQHNPNAWLWVMYNHGHRSHAPLMEIIKKCRILIRLQTKLYIKQEEQQKDNHLTEKYKDH